MLLRTGLNNVALPTLFKVVNNIELLMLLTTVNNVGSTTLFNPVKLQAHCLPRIRVVHNVYTKRFKDLNLECHLLK